MSDKHGLHAYTFEDTTEERAYAQQDRERRQQYRGCEGLVQLHTVDYVN